MISDPPSLYVGSRRAGEDAAYSRANNFNALSTIDHNHFFTLFLRPTARRLYAKLSHISEMDSFIHDLKSSRVIFGAGSVNQLPAEIKKCNASSPLFLSTARGLAQAQMLSSVCSDAGIESTGAYNGAVMHTPTAVTLEAMAHLRDSSADCIVSIGGGSVIGLGKALSFRTGLPHLCVPTTYSGSEMTPILGETDNGEKVTKSNPRILPATVIYDVDLTMTLPDAVCVTSGVNAMAHAVEALYAANTTPVISLMALEGIKALAEALLQVVSDGSSKDTRERALYGAWLCGICLGNTSMGIHHKLCHMLGGSYGLPHSETHTILLPHSLAYNAPSIPRQMELLASVIPGSDGDAVRGLNLFLERFEAPRALKDFGLKRSDLDAATERAMSVRYPNPRELQADELRELLGRAWAGLPAVISI
jgi:alcohol dehydrogenase class IV